MRTILSTAAIYAAAETRVAARIVYASIDVSVTSALENHTRGAELGSILLVLSNDTEPEVF
jgi:hypothetical protein